MARSILELSLFMDSEDEIYCFMKKKTGINRGDYQHLLQSLFEKTRIQLPKAVVS